MLLERSMVALIMIPVAGVVIAIGGWFFTLFVAGLLVVAAWEYWRMTHQSGFSPNTLVLFGGVILLTVLRYFAGFTASQVALSALVLTAMAVHTRSYEKGDEQSASNFGLTLAGLLYIGWLGGYLVSLRLLDDGGWWMLTALPAAWLADTGAYFFGIRFGNHRLSPRVSPRKSWEGYLAGIPVAVLGCAGLAALWHTGVPTITPEKGALLGLAIGILSPLGDLGESMIKRQFGAKDSSNILPGHGGILDRIDSTLWAGVIGYYLIVFFML